MKKRLLLLVLTIALLPGCCGCERREPLTAPYFAGNSRGECVADRDCLVQPCGGVCTPNPNLLLRCVSGPSETPELKCGCVEGQCSWYRRVSVCEPEEELNGGTDTGSAPTSEVTVCETDAAADACTDAGPAP